MSGLIADAKTLIDKARVETQVSILRAHFIISSLLAIYLHLTYFPSSSEPLVHLQ